MCFLPTDKMTLTQSVTHKMQCFLQRQRLFLNKLNLKELNKDEFIKYMDTRTACYHCIKVPHLQFHTSPQTFAAAINILDVFLWKVKVTERHITVVSVACFFIAAKMLEPEESCPDARQLSFQHEWTANDLCRMELQILGKLNWSVSTVSYVDFLQLFADVYGVNHNVLNCEKVTALAQKSLSKKSTVLLEPAVLALSLIHHVNSDTRNNPAEQQVIVHCNIQETELTECQENLSVYASTLLSLSPTRFQHKLPIRRFDKPSEMGITCLPTIVEEPSA